MQLTLLPAAHKVLLYVGLCNGGVTLFKVVKVAGYVKLCVCTNTRVKDEKSGAQPVKAERITVSFQLSFALKHSSTFLLIFIHFFFFANL